MNRSRTRRAYLPVGADGLRALLDSGAVGSPRRDEADDRSASAYAVTVASRARYSGSDEEDLEYDAMRAARHACDSQGIVPVVLAVDVPAGDLADDAGGGSSDPRHDDGVFSVRLTAPVPRAAVVSAHVELDGPDEELSWYDTTELEQLIALLSHR